jgi:deazaflavin-dependent oxidoreductase (nitroreductase family)
MAFPRRLARFNRVVTNRVARPIASVAPGFAVVVHAGRRTRRTYRTPVNAYRRDDEIVIVLTYSSRSDWVANVVAAGGCRLVRRGRSLELTNPQLLRGAAAEQRFPRFVAPFLRATGVDEALVLSVRR